MAGRLRSPQRGPAQEVSPEAIHDLILAGIITFEDLYRAARTWRATDGSNISWIKEMADLRLGRAAA